MTQTQRGEWKTPLAVLDDWAKEQQTMFGAKPPLIEIQASHRKWTSVAHLEVEPASAHGDRLQRGYGHRHGAQNRPIWTTRRYDLAKIRGLIK